MLKTPPASNVLPLLSFRLGEQLYALPIDAVVEVAAMVERVTLPQMPPEALGVANRHGQPLPLLDLRVIFRQPAEPVTSATVFIVAAHGARMAGLVVDEIHQVEYVDARQLSQIDAPAQYIHGIINHKSALMPIIALGALLDACLTRQNSDVVES